MKQNYTRRTANLKARKKAHRAKKIRNFRTTSEINKRLFSRDAMRLAADSVKGFLEGTIVYIDLLSNHLPKTLNNKPYHLPEWRHISEQAKGCFYQLAGADIEAQSDLIAAPFTFNLSVTLWKAAAEDKSPDVTYLQHRIKTTLKRALKRAPDFWFAYELNHSPNNTGKPHLHGTILLKPTEYKKARDAFHQMNGNVSPDFKRHAIVFSSGKRQRQTKELGGIYTNLKWALYCTKERGFTRYFYLPRQNTVTASRLLAQAAKQYYQQTRQHQSNVISHR
ncbi:hypothetical protein [Methylotuvimicrobium sp. KM1]|uniref:hypothetical protein n=1 Tax=Methylotuvimicrobium sp. KM1 TaxID=3377707 RepID=UPI00384EFDDB